MATYSSYKKVNPSVQFPPDSIDQTNLEAGAGNNYGVDWVYPERGMRCHHCANAGGCVCQACGRCCSWQVPANTTSVTFEIWSGGGAGAGNARCECAATTQGGAGGNYAVKTITTTPGASYRVCAGGTWPCYRTYQTASMGCKSFVQGTGLSNFCVTGGCGGINFCSPHYCPRRSGSCANCNICGIFGADFGIMGTPGHYMGSGDLTNWCNRQMHFTGVAPFVGVFQSLGPREYECICGCRTNFPAGGGLPGTSSCCGANAGLCCTAGAQGGAGMVKITYS